MPRKLSLPAAGLDPKALAKQHSREVGSRKGKPTIYPLPLAHLHPVIHIGHRVVGNVATSYRELVDHELIAVIEGTGDFHVGNARYSYGPGSLLIIPPCTPHVVITRSGHHGDHLAMHFDLSPTTPNAGFSLSRPNYAVTLDHAQLPHCVTITKKQLALIVDAIHEHRAETPLSDLRASHKLQELFMELLAPQDKQDRGKEDPEVTHAIAYLATHYNADISVDDLASVAGLQRSRFAQRFKAWTGRPPMAFLRRYRIERAADFLHDHPEWNLEAVAHECGFADAFGFSKAFKAELGVSPSEFRGQL